MRPEVGLSVDSNWGSRGLEGEARHCTQCWHSMLEKDLYPYHTAHCKAFLCCSYSVHDKLTGRYCSSL